MAIIAQSEVFSWENVEGSDEIERLRRVLESLPDEELVRALERDRRGRRDDYPVRAVWNCMVAGIVFGHATTAALIREITRNAELRQVCGLNLVKRKVRVNGVVREQSLAPSASVFSRLSKQLAKHIDLVGKVFQAVLTELAKWIPDLGRDLAVDSKAIPVFGSRPGDADTGTKSYEGRNGRPGTWFGYKLHLVVDANLELPLSFEVTKASVADSPRLLPMLEDLKEKHPEIYERVESASADKGYDDGADKKALYDEGIVPLIPPRNLWSQGETLRPLDSSVHDTIYMNGEGRLHCKIAPFESDPAKAFARMQYTGFEKTRGQHKFRCPAATYGIECHNREACKCSPTVRDGEWGRTVRVSLDRDLRIFGPVLFDTQTFRKMYNKRTSVERVNSRLDNIFGLEHTYLRGLARIRLQVTLILSVMNAVALSWIRMGKPQNVRRILSAA